MLCYRALNNYDNYILDNLKRYGICNKYDLYSQMWDEYLVRISTYKDNTFKEYYELFQELFNGYELNYLINDFIFETPIERVDKSRKHLPKYQNPVSLNHENKNDFDIKFDNYIMEIISTINNHLLNGSVVQTQWISFTKDLEALKRYYNEQTINNVAVIDSNIERISDGNLLALDYSSKEVIKKNNVSFNKPICDIFGNKIYSNTNINSTSINYAVDSKELLYYSYIPKERILNVIGPLELDLMLNGLYNYDLKDNANFYEKTIKSIHLIYDKLSEEQRYVIVEHYMAHIPIKILANNEEEKENLIKIKQGILDIFSQNDTYISHKGKCEKLVMEKIEYKNN